MTAPVVIVEGIGMRLPMVAMPYSNRFHMAHPAFTENVEKLRTWGVKVLLGPGGFEPHLPNGGSARDFLWHLILEAR